MFLKNDSKFSKNLTFLKVITIILCSLLAAGSVVVGVILLLQPGTTMLYIGIGVAAGGAVVFIFALFIILAILNMKGAVACDIKLIRNKLYGNDNYALFKYIGEDANEEVVSAPDQLATVISAAVATAPAAPMAYSAPAPMADEAPAPVAAPTPVAAPAPAPVEAPAPVAAPAPVPARAPKASAKAAKKPAKTKPAVDTSGVDPAEVARLDALLEKGTITADMYRQMIESKKKK